MINDVLSSIDGIAVYPIVGLIVSMIAFLALTIRAMRMDRSKRERMRMLPLEASGPSPEEEINDAGSR